jgi:hypothetical protein
LGEGRERFRRAELGFDGFLWFYSHLEIGVPIVLVELSEALLASKDRGKET